LVGRVDRSVTIAVVKSMMLLSPSRLAGMFHRNALDHTTLFDMTLRLSPPGDASLTMKGRILFIARLVMDATAERRRFA
jgi:hypothetical protein